MNKLIKGAVDVVPESVKTVIEVEEVFPLPEPQGGFPWCGVGIGVGVVVLAAVCAKFYKCTAKK